MSNGINFPRIHVATSVVNRILNIHDEIKESKRPAAPVPQTAPNVPDPTLEGGMLDMQLQQPTPPVDGGPQLTGAVIGKGLGLV